jgi:hypothetical protein
LPTRPCVYTTKQSARNYAKANRANKRKRWANFGTLTIKNPPIVELKDYLKIISKAFARMFKRKSLK